MTKFESVLSQALELGEDERQLLAIRLEMSLGETEDSTHNELWAAEIKRRLDELDSGQADEIDWDEAMKFIFED